MKRITALLMMLVTLLALSACAQGKPVHTDMEKIYGDMESHLPEMMVLDDTFRMNLLGIDAGDCNQVITAICGEGLLADEVWLIEAKDSTALAHIQKLAENRLQAKADETESYVPDQYLIVKQGQIITEGLYLALLVSPEVGSLQSVFEAAVK